MITQPEADGQLALGFVEIDEERQEAWEYAVLVTSLEAEVLTRCSGGSLPPPRRALRLAVQGGGHPG